MANIRENISKLGRFNAACMTRLTLTFLIAFSFCIHAIAQKKKISLEEIWGGEFRTEGLAALEPSKSGNTYTVLNFDRASRQSTIDRYDYDTQEKSETLVSSANIPGILLTETVLIKWVKYSLTRPILEERNLSISGK